MVDHRIQSCDEQQCNPELISLLVVDDRTITSTHNHRPFDSIVEIPVLQPTGNNNTNGHDWMDATDHTGIATIASNKVCDESVNNNNNNNNDNTIIPIHSGIVQQQQFTITVDEAIDRIGFGWFQRTIMIATGLCFGSDSIQIMVLSFLSIQIQIEWKSNSNTSIHNDDYENITYPNNNAVRITNDAAIDKNRTSALTAAIFAGAFCGTLVLGPLSDRIGRRITFLLSASIVFMFAFVGIALCTPSSSDHSSYMLLGSMIFGVGFGIGGLPIPFDIFAECLPSTKRGQQLLVIEYFWSLGGMFAVAMAYAFLESNWRYFVAICAVPTLLSFIFGYLYVPESPRWLCENGQTDRALQILKLAALRNGYTQNDIDQYVFPSYIQLRESQDQHQQTVGNDQTLTNIFQPKYRYLIARIWCAWFTMAFGYYGAIFVIARVFHNNDNNDRTELLLDNHENRHQYLHNSDNRYDYGAIFTSSAAELVATTFIVLTIDRIGRIPTQIVSYGAAGICICILTFLESSSNDTSHSHGTSNGRHWILVGLGFCTRLFEMAGSCVTWVMTVEVLPTSIRGTGHSIANAFARIGAFLCPFVVEKWNLSTVGWTMLLLHFVTVSCVCTIPETTGNRMGSLEDTNDDDHYRFTSLPPEEEQQQEHDEHRQQQPEQNERSIDHFTRVSAEEHLDD